MKPLRGNDPSLIFFAAATAEGLNLQSREVDLMMKYKPHPYLSKSD